MISYDHLKFRLYQSSRHESFDDRVMFYDEFRFEYKVLPRIHVQNVFVFLVLVIKPVQNEINEIIWCAFGQHISEEVVRYLQTVF